MGIRKILGATERNIVLIFSKQFLRWVLVANALAIPIALLLMDAWLDGFAYRTGISFTSFAFPSLIALATAMLTVGFQAS